MSPVDPLRRALKPLADVPGLGLQYRSPQGTIDLTASSAGDPIRLELDASPGCELLLYPDGIAEPWRALVETAVRAIVDKLNVEHREGLLLDELGANWESLEALYEISTDVLRFGDIREALQRLIQRFTSLQDGLHACLMVGRNNRLERIASSHECPAVFDWSDLGPLADSIRANNATVIDDASSVWPADAAATPWSGAASLAAAP